MPATPSRQPHIRHLESSSTKTWNNCDLVCPKMFKIGRGTNARLSQSLQRRQHPELFLKCRIHAGRLCPLSAVSCRARGAGARGELCLRTTVRCRVSIRGAGAGASPRPHPLAVIAFVRQLLRFTVVTSTRSPRRRATYVIFGHPGAGGPRPAML